MSVCWSVPREGDGELLSGSGLLADRLLKLGLIPPDLLAGKAQLRGNLQLRDVLAACFGDGAAERKARLSDLPAGREVGIARSDDGSHRVSHLCIVTPVWPIPSMRHIRVPRN